MSIEQRQYPVAIRVPWNGVFYADREMPIDYSDINRFELVKEGSKVAILALGGFYQLGEAVVKQLEEKHGINASLINPRYISGVDKNMLNELKNNHEVVVTIEDGILEGGFGSKITQFYGNSSMKVLTFGFSSEFPEVYDAKQMMIDNGLTPDLISSSIVSAIS